MPAFPKEALMAIRERDEEIKRLKGLIFDLFNEVHPNLLQSLQEKADLASQYPDRGRMKGAS